MIITVTPNPAYDVTYELPDLVPGAMHRVAGVRQRAGGKGINVARVLTAIGSPVSPLALADQAFAEQARAEGLDLDAIDGVSGVRRTLVVRTADGTTTSLWEPGHPVAESAVDELRNRLTGQLPSARGVVVSGSLPPGCPAELPAQLATLAVAAGLPVVVDVDDEALQHAARAEGVVLMPNTEELSRLTGRVCERSSDVVAAARALIAAGVSAVVATRGADGMLAVCTEGAWQARLDASLAGNPTGAGDAAAAAVIRGLAAGDVGWPDLLREAVALSAAAVLAPVAGEVEVDFYRGFVPRVVVTAVPMPRSAA